MKATFSQTKKSTPWITALMIMAIAGVTAFQLYWLKQSYNREKNALHIKTNAAFQETVMELQFSKLNLQGIENIRWEGAKSEKDSGVRVFVSAPSDTMKIKLRPRREMVSSINIIRKKLSDSLGNGKKGNVMITVNEASNGA